MLEEQQQILMPLMPGQNADPIIEKRCADTITIYLIRKENELIKIYFHISVEITNLKEI